MELPAGTYADDTSQYKFIRQIKYDKSMTGAIPRRLKNNMASQSMTERLVSGNLNYSFCSTYWR